jgi:hypothetical protein
VFLLVWHGVVGRKEGSGVALLGRKAEALSLSMSKMGLDGIFVI